MANEKRPIAYSADRFCEIETIKAHMAQIIVSGNAEKPYYEILYFDTADRKYHIGYSSFDLANVFRWLSEVFEIVPYVPGRWEPAGHDTLFQCSECGFVIEPAETNYCPNCGARMDGETEG